MDAFEHFDIVFAIKNNCNPNLILKARTSAPDALKITLWTFGMPKIDIEAVISWK